MDAVSETGAIDISLKWPYVAFVIKKKWKSNRKYVVAVNEKHEQNSIPYLSKAMDVLGRSGTNGHYLVTDTLLRIL